jgi:PAS domain S-box-containing protein
MQLGAIARSATLTGSNAMSEQPDLAAQNEVLRRQLAESERLRAHYFHLYNQAPIGYLTLNSDGLIVGANQTAARLLGSSAEAGLWQRPLSDFIPPESQPLYRQQCALLFTTGLSQECEIQLTQPTRPPHWVRMEGAIVQNDTTGDPMARVLLSDIQQQKQSEAERELQAAILKGIIDSANIGIFSLDRDYRYTSFNQFHADSMKTIYNADVAIGGVLSDYQIESDWIEAKKNIDRTLSGESVYTAVYSGDAQLTRRYYAIIHSPILNLSEQIIGAAILTQDITEQRQAEEALRASERKLSSIFRAAPVGIGLVSQRVLLEVNDTFCQMLGYSREELIGQNSRVLYPSDEVYEFVGQEKYRQITNRGTGSVETQMREKSGEVLDVILSSTPLDLEDLASGVTFTTLNITKRKQAERALQESYNRLAEAMTDLQTTQAQLVRQERLAAVGQLSAGIAHDFNNIMAVIVLYAQLMSQSGQLSLKDRERVAIIEQQAKNAARLTEQILDFSRRTVLKRQSLDLAVLLEEQIGLLRRTLQEDIEIKLDLLGGPYKIFADSTRIEQVITNLSLNARDALPHGGILRFQLARIRVESGSSPLLPEMAPGDWIQLSVSDNGLGIPLEAMPHLFEPFFTTKGPGKGSGLGLPQVHGIIGQHQGRIEVSSEVGQGTTITIYLPALVEDVTAADVPVKPRLPLGNLETVLVVEDSEAVREALRDSLELLNYRVLTASNGQEALMMLAKPDNQIALILSDVVMSAMGGIALLRAVRQRPERIPLILLTGHPRQDNIEGLFIEGLDAWLVKPPALEKLAKTVANLLNPDAPRQA